MRSSASRETVPHHATIPDLMAKRISVLEIPEP